MEINTMCRKNEQSCAKVMKISLARKKANNTTFLINLSQTPTIVAGIISTYKKKPQQLRCGSAPPSGLEPETL